MYFQSDFVYEQYEQYLSKKKVKLSTSKRSPLASEVDLINILFFLSTLLKTPTYYTEFFDNIGVNFSGNNYIIL